MSFFHVPGIYIMFYDIPSIPSKSSGSVPVFIIEHHTIPHLQEALSASCQPVLPPPPLLSAGQYLLGVFNCTGSSSLWWHQLVQYLPARNQQLNATINVV